MGKRSASPFFARELTPNNQTTNRTLVARRASCSTVNILCLHYGIRQRNKLLGLL